MERLIIGKSIDRQSLLEHEKEYLIVCRLVTRSAGIRLTLLLIKLIKEGKRRI